MADPQAEGRWTEDRDGRVYHPKGSNPEASATVELPEPPTTPPQFNTPAVKRADHAGLVSQVLLHGAFLFLVAWCGLVAWLAVVTSGQSGRPLGPLALSTMILLVSVVLFAWSHRRFVRATARGEVSNGGTAFAVVGWLWTSGAVLLSAVVLGGLLLSSTLSDAGASPMAVVYGVFALGTSIFAFLFYSFSVGATTASRARSLRLWPVFILLLTSFVMLAGVVMPSSVGDSYEKRGDLQSGSVVVKDLRFAATAIHDKTLELGELPSASEAKDLFASTDSEVSYRVLFNGDNDVYRYMLCADFREEDLTEPQTDETPLSFLGDDGSVTEKFFSTGKLGNNCFMLYNDDLEAAAERASASNEKKEEV